jgi:hypothetical protein
VDNPQTISPGQKLQSIIIDVKNANDERQYKITFFVRSGLIQAQGNHYHEFATKDFPALFSIMHHLSGPLPVIGSQPTIVSPSYALHQIFCQKFSLHVYYLVGSLSV